MLAGSGSAFADEPLAPVLPGFNRLATFAPRLLEDEDYSETYQFMARDKSETAVFFSLVITNRGVGKSALRWETSVLRPHEPPLKASGAFAEEEWRYDKQLAIFIAGMDVLKMTAAGYGIHVEAAQTGIRLVGLPVAPEGVPRQGVFSWNEAGSRTLEIRAMQPHLRVTGYLLVDGRWQPYEGFGTGLHTVTNLPLEKFAARRLELMLQSGGHWYTAFWIWPAQKDKMPWGVALGGAGGQYLINGPAPRLKVGKAQGQRPGVLPESLALAGEGVQAHLEKVTAGTALQAQSSQSQIGAMLKGLPGERVIVSQYLGRLAFETPVTAFAVSVSGYARMVLPPKAKAIKQ